MNILPVLCFWFWWNCAYRIHPSRRNNTSTKIYSVDGKTSIINTTRIRLFWFDSLSSRCFCFSWLLLKDGLNITKPEWIVRGINMVKDS